MAAPGGPNVAHAPLCPSLPPEIWIRILSYHDDLTHLWSICRAVSPTFLAYSEQVFAEYILRDTYIDWALEKYNLGGKSRRPEMNVTFARFSSDAGKNVACFGAKSGAQLEYGGERQRKWRLKLGITEKSVMERWEERVRNSRPEQPNYTIRIGDMVNDTALPGLAFDSKNNEIRFEWRDMFGAFFREQLRFAALRKRWYDNVARRLRQVENGEPLDAQDLYEPWSFAEVRITKQVRRARIREWYKEKGNEEMVWAVDSLEYYEKWKKDDGMLTRSLGEIPGAGLGERWFGSTYWVQTLHMDEQDCLHRINVKVLAGSGGVNDYSNDGARKLPQQRARSMSVASTITVS
ncbi:hypothetical protein K504DRAFT_467924 [Pleomassaria siparia CBS 279.74]|uniref:F-box domain-containing protein n=1 Tax=Pleomassaria siparia CBS 279.74 TaxID=1314801 RepID=A0A6G1K826_9PLEO|nr:hypothetical protein K504DRAFT_467924 [Pleomassaria siparia CBS 279.74]